MIASRQPHFLIAGMMRCGTTALSSWLRHHPDVFIPAVKEVHYFDLHYELGPDWYAEQFAPAASDHTLGEATPNYAYRADAWTRLTRDLPDVQLLLLLRDPVERAHSHFLHNAARERETLPLREALAAEPARPAERDQAARDHFSYVDRGRYLGQLQRILEEHPSSRVKILLFEDLRDHPRRTFTDVARFLGIDESHIPDEVGTQVNAYQQFRSLRAREWGRSLPKPVRDAIGRLNRLPVTDYPTLPEPIRRQLVEEFAGERPALRELLGRDLHEWHG